MRTKPALGTGKQPPDLSSLCLAMTEHAPMPMATVEGASHIVRYVNPAFCRLINKPKDQLEGKSFCEMLPDKGECVTLLDRVFRTGKPESHTEPEHSELHPVLWSYTAWPVIGNERPVGVIIQVAESAEFHEKTLAMNEALILGSVRQHELTEAAAASNTQLQEEIRERKRTEAQLRASFKEKLSLADRLSLATAVAKVGVWEWDLASNTLTWDATMYDIYGFPPVVPMPYERWAAAVHPEDLPATESSLHKTIDEKGQGSAEYRIIRPDGSVRNVSRIERVVLDERDNVSRLIGVNMDVTERKQAEQALEEIRQGQIRFKDEFLSHVSHELRSPLTAIKQFTSILMGGLAGELNTEQRQYQEIVLKNIHQLQSMIDDLLEVTRLETGKLTVEPESVSVAEAVMDILNTLEGTARAKAITLSCDLPLDLPRAHADPTRLRQLLIILLDNAIKFTPVGGAVTIQARLLPQEPRFLLLEVADTGCGISSKMTERIFDRLYQEAESIKSSRKGLGLGLYICKELVTRQGGKIWVKSKLHKGSTFSLTLPLFSLNNLIAPLLKNEKWPLESVALVRVETHSGDGWHSKESQEKWSREARSLLQRCFLPDRDVLLPTMSSGAQGERFFVAAFADEKGASVLANRIREQFARLPHLNQTGLTVSVSYSMLEPAAPDVGASIENLVASMAANLEASTKSSPYLGGYLS